MKFKDGVTLANVTVTDCMVAMIKEWAEAVDANGECFNLDFTQEVRHHALHSEGIMQIAAELYLSKLGAE